jgi:hypothetical protein
MAGRIGPLATIYREPGQARKGAAAAVDSSAGVWLVRTATFIFPSICLDLCVILPPLPHGIPKSLPGVTA